MALPVVIAIPSVVRSESESTLEFICSAFSKGIEALRKLRRAFLRQGVGVSTPSWSPPYTLRKGEKLFLPLERALRARFGFWILSRTSGSSRFNFFTTSGGTNLSLDVLPRKELPKNERTMNRLLACRCA